MKSFLAGNTWVDAAQWMTASIPSMQASTELRSRMFPCRCSIGNPSNVGDVVPVSCKTRTTWPRSSKTRTKLLPKTPSAPVTITFMNTKLRVAGFRASLHFQGHQQVVFGNCKEGLGVP